jgi:hypothetical protein
MEADYSSETYPTVLKTTAGWHSETYSYAQEE